MWIEVHNRDGKRLAIITDMLQRHGFHVTSYIDDLPLLESLQIYAVFATRRTRA
jgi:hypothetical protein